MNVLGGLYDGCIKKMRYESEGDANTNYTREILRLSELIIMMLTIIISNYTGNIMRHGLRLIR